MASRTPPSERLAAWLAGRRWYATKTRRIEGVEVRDRLALGGAAILILRVAFEGGADRYCVPVRPLAPGPSPDRRRDRPPAGDGEIADALDDPGFCRALLDLALTGGRLRGERGEIVARPGAAPAAPRPDLEPRRVGGEQTNSSVVFGQALILKLFRRLPDGENPEAEMTRFLTERARFPHSPALHGHLEYRDETGGAATLAVVQALVPGARDGWEWVLEALRPLYASPAPVAAGPALEALGRLGEVTGALHQALASDSAEAAFAPEAIVAADVAAWAAAVRGQLEEARAALGEQAAGALPAPRAVEASLEGLLGRQKIRHHGDLHLGQTLYRPDEGRWVIIDFEGEPMRPLAARRQKHAAVRDVAGMLRSIAYAAEASLREAATWPGAAEATPRGAAGGPCDHHRALAEGWESEARRAFLDGYRAATRGAPFLPASEAAFTRALAVFELEKAAYEVVYEANNRPDWIAIPRRGLLSAAARLEPPPRAGEA